MKNINRYQDIESARNLRFYLIVMAALWSVVILGVTFYNVQNTKDVTHELILKDARSSFKKDQAFRFWASSHGGVYVPITEHTPPNPGLDHIKERDIETPSGIKLTLMNPAYMVRQMNEDYRDLYGVLGHITSLKPIRELNQPDKWERQALLQFEQGIKEISGYTEIAGEPFFRLMQPMITRQGCLKCHEFQGYKLGDVRGGVDVSVPVSEYWHKRDATISKNISLFVLLWIIGIALIWVGSRKLLKQACESDSIQKKLMLSEKQLRLANDDLAQFAIVASHHIQEPLRLIGSYSGLLKRRYQEKLDDEANEYIDYTVKSAERLQQLINDLLSFSHTGSVRLETSLVDPNQILVKLIDNITTEAQIDCKKMPMVKIDKAHLESLLENLIDNALRYCEGKIPKIEIDAIEENGYWHCRVKDNGIGIDARYQQRIFNLFERLHGESESTGTGIGLALSKKIVEIYDGQIWVESEVGEGSTFHFTIAQIADNTGQG